MGNQTRKLQAILFADIVKFSALMVEDEAECIRIRNAVANLAHQCAADHHGAVRNEAGDGFMLVFSSAVDAIGAALAMQGGMSELDLIRPDGKPAQLRIGIHSGDIVQEDESIIGDAVNIAARIETVAVPGGICVSSEIEAQVRPVLNLAFHPVKRRPSKPFPRPIEIFDVGETDVALHKMSARVSRRLLILSVVGLLLAAAILLLLSEFWPRAGWPAPPYRAEVTSSEDADIILYAAPGVGSEQLGRIKSGGTVKIEEHREVEGGGDWARISIRPGWMATHDLRIQDPGMSEMIAVKDPAAGSDHAAGTVVYDGTDGLNVRPSPDYASKEYLSLREGTQIKLFEGEVKTASHIWRQVGFLPAWIHLTDGKGTGNGNANGSVRVRELISK